MNNKSSLVNLGIGYIIVWFIGILFLTNESLLTTNKDLLFLYNRAEQIYQCFMDGNFPYFFYNDFGGVGYGSSFFYGYYTLIPFALLVPYGSTVFIEVFIVVTIVLTYFGISFFASRFTNNYKLVAVLYITSVFFLKIYYSTGLYTNFFAIALSFFFLAFCVDFFRDSKSFIPATLMFYIIVNTHMITTLVSFIICVYIFIRYFDKTRLRNYIQFALITFLTCIYFISNFIYHLDLNLDYLTDTTILFENLEKFNSVFTQSPIPFGGFIAIFLGLNNSLTGYNLLNIGVLFVCLIVLFKRRKTLSKFEIITLVLILALSILSIHKVWIPINKVVSLIIQFPLRLTPYILVSFFIICFRFDVKRYITILLIILSIPDLLFLHTFFTKSEDIVIDEVFKLECQVINAEYLDSSFNWDLNTFNYYRSTVHDELGNTYEYSIDNGTLYINLELENDSVLTFPKLYYRGYVCYNQDTGEKYKTTKGYSQFISVSFPENTKGTICLEYRHPIFLAVIDWIVLLLCMFLMYYYFISKFYKKKSQL